MNAKQLSRKLLIYRCLADARSKARKRGGVVSLARELGIRFRAAIARTKFIKPLSTPS